MLSSKSVLKFNPNAKITIFTDQPIGKTGKNIKVVSFQVRPRPAISKVQAIIEHDAGKSIFLDTDTKIKGSLDQIWHALDQFDLVIANELKNICGENVSLSNPKYKKFDSL
jgi:sugar/nucleoside kinase (ribokinase family)